MYQGEMPAPGFARATRTRQSRSRVVMIDGSDVPLAGAQRKGQGTPQRCFGSPPITS
jgi:hypothetical protein